MTRIAAAAHDHAHHRRAAGAEPRLSALGLSGFERLAHAAIVVAILWIGVYWALS